MRRKKWRKEKSKTGRGRVKEKENDEERLRDLPEGLWRRNPGKAGKHLDLPTCT